MARKIEVVVAVIGRAHGIKGEVGLDVRTDEPERRIVPQARLYVEGEPHRTFTVTATRWHSGRLLARFAELADRTAAEQVKGLRLAVSVPASERPDDEEEFYDHQLVGLLALDDQRRRIGEVIEVVHGAAQELLLIKVDDTGEERLVPFVSALVPEVDLAAGCVVIAPVEGLLADVDDAATSDAAGEDA